MGKQDDGLACLCTFIVVCAIFEVRCSVGLILYGSHILDYLESLRYKKGRLFCVDGKTGICKNVRQMGRQVSTVGRQGLRRSNTKPLPITTMLKHGHFMDYSSNHIKDFIIINMFS